MVRNSAYDKLLLYTIDMIQKTFVTHMMPEIENSWKYKFHSWLKVLATWQFKQSPGECFFLKVFKKQNKEAQLVLSKESNTKDFIYSASGTVT